MMDDKELRKMLRSKRKAERNKIKKLIKNKFLENWNGVKIDFGYQLDTENKLWTITWHTYIEFPDWFDSYARDGLVNEPHIKGLAKDIYKSVSNQAWEIFDKCKTINNRNGRFYNLITTFPPMHIVIPDRYEYINGEWTKVADVRVMSDEEIEEFIESNKQRFDDFDEKWWRKVFETDKRNMKYYEFVGGSEFEHECWRIKKYVGMRVYGSFTIPAENEFKPSYLD
jgi:hypothetical protein